MMNDTFGNPAVYPSVTGLGESALNGIHFADNSGYKEIWADNFNIVFRALEYDYDSTAPGNFLFWVHKNRFLQIQFLDTGFESVWQFQQGKLIGKPSGQDYRELININGSVPSALLGQTVTQYSYTGGWNDSTAEGEFGLLKTTVNQLLLALRDAMGLTLGTP